jgi:hypothetical protein
MEVAIRTLIAVVVVVVAMLAVALPAFAQEEQGQAGCAWYWDYTFVASGGWEYECWDPIKGWWFTQREDGKAQHIIL